LSRSDADWLNLKNPGFNLVEGILVRLGGIMSSVNRANNAIILDRALSPERFSLGVR